MQLKIRIVRTPPGEAPLHIREAWIGIILPVKSNKKQPSRKHGFGVLSRPKSFLGMLIAILIGKSIREEGYIVDAKTVVELLREHSPEAADWWTMNVPRVKRSGFLLMFSSDVCEEFYD
jgi:hypothetical protein